MAEQPQPLPAGPTPTAWETVTLPSKVPASGSVGTAMTSDFNPKGQYEFFIDNVVIKSTLVPNKDSRSTNSNEITFDVYEPYSMSLFLQTLRIAAQEAGWSAFNQAVYLLTIEFVGWDSNGEAVPLTDQLTRQLPILINDIKMSVTASGTKYSITASPSNELAFTDGYGLLKTDMKISGQTVSEMLQSGPNSLQFWLNSSLEDINKRYTDKSKIRVDEIAIVFPIPMEPSKKPLIPMPTAKIFGKDILPSSKDASAGAKIRLTENSSKLLVQDASTINDIGKAKMKGKKGDAAPVAESGSRRQGSGDPKRTDLPITDDVTAQFPVGKSISDTITEVILQSEYGWKAIEGAGKDEARGMIKWFRIETMIEYNAAIKTASGGSGSISKLLTYRVVPYYVHASVFSPAGENDTVGYEEIKKQVAKEYNYIYTGKNLDILKFEIEYHANAFTVLTADVNSKGAPVYQQLAGDKPEPPDGSGGGGARAPTPNPESPTGTPEQSSSGVRGATNGGALTDTYKTLIAKHFYDALLLAPSDMINLDMDIVGDPYYIADSGMGSFNDTPITMYINKNGSINHQAGEVDIIVNFRTPIDYDPETGIMMFADTMIDPTFSGLYKVNEVTSTFNRNKFTQNLSGSRREDVQPKPTELPSPDVKGDEKTSEGKPARSNPTTAARVPAADASKGSPFKSILEDAVDFSLPWWPK